MFGRVPRARPSKDVALVLELKALGYSDRTVSRLSGVPLNTIRTWRNSRSSRLRKLLPPDVALCEQCGGPAHDVRALPADAYAYLLGIYLGDGCLTPNASSWELRVFLDSRYPGIIGEVCGAIGQIRPDREPTVTPRAGINCVTVRSTWQAWLCLFPQHGAGRKHNRAITLTDWQRDYADSALGHFLRGLIHTDGWRGINRVHVKGRDYAYPRYQFSNRSDDIRNLFTDACDKLGIKWSPWTRYHISVAECESVAILDSFVGPKY